MLWLRPIIDSFAPLSISCLVSKWTEEPALKIVGAIVIKKQGIFFYVSSVSIKIKSFE